MFDKHFDDKQRKEIEARRGSLGPDGMLKTQQDWAALKAECRAAIGRGVAATSPEAQALGARWKALVDSFTGGDAATAASLKRMHHSEAGFGKQVGGDDATTQWINKVLGR